MLKRRRKRPSRRLRCRKSLFRTSRSSTNNYTAVAVIGITGGIATGKSTFVRALLRQLPGEFFDADQSARDLLARDPEVRKAVQHEFGADIYDPAGNPDRIRLREVVFASDEKRRRLEAILHPAIRLRWTTLADKHRLADTLFFVDIPLLFETGTESYFD
ncbi:MAG: dephospho-CoA kinase, partial [Verrucomicrobiaceae bacterium]